ncbi:MAG TPA: NmrA family transcriptional regulator [Mycobacteriales bacterium]|jgi:uncharacterized protein YbjT (DUF2867 family)|nr:NmrA family transcriptional regulator [Mycobacteriales bacterium]
MRVAVIGGTGRIGRRTVTALRRTGHDPVAVSRSGGVDVLTGAGLDEALAGAQAVIDVTNTAATDRDAAVDFFATVTTNLLAAEQRAGITHHVVLSIVGIDRVPSNAHYAGKRAQEAAALDGPVPTSVVRATQFHDFPVMIVGWTRQGDLASVPPLLMQPIAPLDVAEILAEISTGVPQGRYRDVAGPEPQDLVDMARRTLAARGEDVRLVPTWRGIFSTDMSGEVLLPSPDARIAPTTFEQWLAAGGAAEIP